MPKEKAALWSVAISVVAEGVAEQRELGVLQGLRCTHAQGYYLSRPTEAASFEIH